MSKRSRFWDVMNDCLDLLVQQENRGTAVRLHFVFPRIQVLHVSKGCESLSFCSKSRMLLLVVVVACRCCSFVAVYSSDERQRTEKFPKMPPITV